MEWERDFSGDSVAFRTKVKNVSGNEYSAMVLYMQKLGAWNASLVVNGKMIHLSEHMNWDLAQNACMNAYTRATKIRAL